MTEKAFKAMQDAVDVVNTSPHPTYKIASAVFGDDFCVTATNYWPETIEKAIGRETRIGQSSSTIHAETAALLKAPKTDGASICITDPFCPNCAKNIAEAGIKKIYIDHKGFKKKFWEESGNHFENMSMEIAAKAGISVYEINRKKEKIITIYEPPKGYVASEDSPIQIDPCPESKGAYTQILYDMMRHYHNRKFVTAMVKTPEGSTFCMTARVHAVVGYTIQNDVDIETMMNPGKKYSLLQEPMNRLLMAARRKGYTVLTDYLFISQIPTSREQVNMVGAGITNILIGDPYRARNKEAIKAKNLLEKNKILTFETCDFLF
ncbi:MAG: deoxycytidylate deaminase [Alphaproteobacteria bacterium]|nr:deoxycytidylate deaminase [Alphaproteobacteria bacterium]